MRGLIFNFLSDMVEEKFGLEVLDTILDKAKQSGVYVAAEYYPDEKLFDLVVAAHEISGIPVNDLVKTFGEYMFPRFIESNPHFIDESMTLKDFLLTVDRVIHVEVRKLHPEAKLPKFTYKDESDGELTMYYNSERKLCYLAEGLIAGAAKHFNTSYVLDHSQCMHDGAAECTLHLTINSANT